LGAECNDRSASERTVGIYGAARV